MATWKRLRALEAAARAGDAAARRELARAAREQQTLQATLGAVDKLIGVAPQLSEAYSQSIAQDILSGKEAAGAPTPKEDDILGQIGAFIREPWRAQGEKMARSQAAQMAPQELAKIRPLLRQEFGKEAVPLDTPEARQQVSKEEFERRISAAREPEQRMRDEIQKAVPLTLLPEQQREAMVAGEMQRFQREEEEKAKEDAMLSAQIAKLAPGAPSVSLPKPSDVNAMAGAVVGSTAGRVQALQQKLNSTDENIRAKAFEDLSTIIDDSVNSLTMPDGSELPDVWKQAAKGKSIQDISKSLELPALNATEVSNLSTTITVIDELHELNDLRDTVGWNPKQEQILRDAFAQGQNAPLGLNEIIKTYNNLKNRTEFTPGQRAFFDKSMAILVRLTNAEYKGSGSVSNQERNALAPYLATPWTTGPEWKAKYNLLIRDIGRKFATTTLALAATNRFDQNIIDRANLYAEVFTPPERKQAEQMRLRIEGGGEKFLDGTEEERKQALAAAMFGAYAQPLETVPAILKGLYDQFTAAMDAGDTSTASGIWSQIKAASPGAPAAAPAAAPAPAMKPAPAAAPASKPAGPSAPNVPQTTVAPAGKVKVKLRDGQIKEMSQSTADLMVRNGTAEYVK